MLLLMDEFPTLGYMEIFVTAIAKIRSYGVRIFIITQSNNQIEDVYGPRHPFTSNCSVRVYYTPNDNPTAEAISAALGTRTEVHQQKTYTGHRFVPMLLHMMVADQEVARALLTPGEVLTFGNDGAIIFVTGCHPIQARKLRYFEDQKLTRRLLPAPALREERPYPYRPKPRVNPWMGVAGVSTSELRPSSNSPRKNEERAIERERGADRREGFEEPAHDADGSAIDRLSDGRFDAWHEASLRALTEGRANEAEELRDLARRGELAREERLHAEAHKRRDRELDLGR